MEIIFIIILFLRKLRQNRDNIEIYKHSEIRFLSFLLLKVILEDSELSKKKNASDIIIK
jgi:hypothetical protein